MTASIVTGAGVNSAASIAAAVNATALNTKGAYTELIASTPYDCNGLTFEAGFFDVYGWLFDVAVGAAGVEQIIASNLMLGTAVMQRYYLPAQIPAGSRIAVRGQCDFNGSKTSYAKAYLLARTAGLRGRSIIDLGANLTSSKGTTLNPGATINTKGAWAELSASAPNDLRELLVALRRDNDNPGAVEASWLVDIGIGAAGAEQVVIPDVWCYATGYNDFKGASTLWMPAQIPTGSRVAARCACNTASSADTLISCIVYGGY